MFQRQSHSLTQQFIHSVTAEEPFLILHFGSSNANLFSFTSERVSSQCCLYIFSYVGTFTPFSLTAYLGLATNTPFSNTTPVFFIISNGNHLLLRPLR